jgi:hypothetical protein
MYSILLFKSKNLYDYIEDNCFLGQIAGQKVFLFSSMGQEVGLIW